MYLQSVHCSGILFFRPALQALYLHIGAKAFLKEHFLNTSISTRYSIEYFAVLEYMLSCWKIDWRKWECSFRKDFTPLCNADIFFSSHFERIAFTALLCGHRGQILRSIPTNFYIGAFTWERSPLCIFALAMPS